MAHVLTAAGLQPDPEKVKAFKEMPTPTDKQSIQRLLGMTNYLQRFAQRLSKIMTPLHELTKINNEFVWDDQVHGPALEETKTILSTTPVLKYFDPSVTPTLQCDASMHGLGACLMRASSRIRIQVPDPHRGSIRSNRKAANSHSICNGEVRNLPVW